MNIAKSITRAHPIPIKSKLSKHRKIASLVKKQQRSESRQTNKKIVKKKKKTSKGVLFCVLCFFGRCLLDEFSADNDDGKKMQIERSYEHS